MNSVQGQGWSATATTAPVADETLIARAYGFLEPGQKLGAFFVPKPTAKARGFLEGLSSRARAALENAARDGK